MPQHSLSLPNADGATVRAGMNTALLALVSLSSGTSAPATTVAGQLWWDTTNDLVKIRNATNTAWIVVASFDGGTWIPYRAGEAIPAMPVFGDAAFRSVGNNTGQLAEVGAGNKFEVGLLPLLNGASSTNDGSAGIVPAPQAGQQGNVLYGNGAFGALPTNSGDANSHILLPTANGSVLIHWGIIATTDPPGFGTVNFSPAFSAPPGVACVAWTNAGTRRTAVRLVNADQAIFQASDASGSALTGGIYWIAIGPG